MAQITQSPTPLLISEREAAVRLGISLSTIRRWRRRKTGPPHIRIGGILRYRIADVDNFVTAHLGEKAGA